MQRQNETLQLLRNLKSTILVILALSFFAVFFKTQAEEQKLRPTSAVTVSHDHRLIRGAVTSHRWIEGRAVDNVHVRAHTRRFVWS